jgi:alpha-N-acetylglucosaminidase
MRIKNMLKIAVYATFILSFLLTGASQALSKEADPIHALVLRIAPAYRDGLVFEKMPADSGRDVFELSSANGKVFIRGNNFNSMAVGLNYYLKYYCYIYVSWYKNDAVQVPAIMPVVNVKIRRFARVKNRFFLNYCTFGYTMPWWGWRDWERLIDWMALNGINMPLSTTGEEAIWYKVWKQLGLTDRQIRSYFTGPAYLPWHRMANIDRWEGPLPQSWLSNQFALEKRIVARERALNMTPVLPAFAGHVPAAIKTKFPNAKITRLGGWGGFAEKYESNFLDPFDPLFKTVQQMFLKEEIKAFGTDHIYGADPFNEVTPPSWEPADLANVSKTIYNSMTATDPAATWLQMTWLFYFNRDKWTNERIKAFITAVPQNKMFLLDYYCEKTEVWKLTDSYFNQPYLWCYLGNFGGNTMLAGNLSEVGKRMENAFKNGGSNLTGVGSTLEGFDVNPVMYDFVFEKVWSAGPVDAGQYITHWAGLRAGRQDEAARKAWEILLNTVYTAPDELGQATLTNAKPGLTGHGNWTTNPQINYNNAALLHAWQLLLQGAANTHASYNFDVVNIGRQVLGNYFSALRDKFTNSYRKGDIAAMMQTRKEMLGLFDDMDKLLATSPSFLLGKWISDARRMGITPQEKNYFEKDARTIITTWSGNDHDLNDYANRTWAGLTKSFYKQRWQMFTDAVIFAARNHQPFDEKAFEVRLNTFENNWPLRYDTFSAVPVGSSVETASELYDKYAGEIKEAADKAAHCMVRAR